jgi:type IV secretory pathway VirB10-like protein
MNQTVVDPAMSPESSPNGLEQNRGPSMTRVNKLPIILVCGVAALIVMVIAYTALQRAAKQREMNEGQKKEEVADSASATPGDMFRTAPTAGEIAATPKPDPLADPALGQAGPAPGTRAAPAMLSPADQALEQQRAQLLQQRRQLLMQALNADTEVRLQGQGSGSGQQAAGSRQGAPVGAIGRAPGADAAASRLAGMEAIAAGMDGGGGGGAADANLQARKESFASNQAGAQFGKDAALIRVPPLVPTELKAGAVIPAVMIGGINSDLPGQIVAQVRQDVFDTASGRTKLIPQGSRLVGRYDSQVAFGQSRVLVVWDRVIFPDGSSLSLAGMPGTDGAGYAGFGDKVNNHTVRTFGAAVLVSLVSAAAQLSQPDTRSSTGNSLTASNQEIAAAALGQQINQFGMSVAQKHLNVQPTLIIRPGYRFAVMVTRDLPLSGYAPMQ